MPKASLEIELPDSGHVVCCDVAGNLVKEGDGWNEPREEYIEDIDVKNICWQRTGRPVKIKAILETVTEAAIEKFEDSYEEDSDFDPPDRDDYEDDDDSR